MAKEGKVVTLSPQPLHLAPPHTTILPLLRITSSYQSFSRPPPFLFLSPSPSSFPSAVLEEAQGH